MKRPLAIVAILSATLFTTATDAEVLRSKGDTPTVWIFKDAEALRRFNKLNAGSVNDDGIVGPLTACKTPQGSKIEVRGSGHRTAFIRVIGGSEHGCEGTVPLDYIKSK